MQRENSGHGGAAPLPKELVLPPHRRTASQDDTAAAAANVVTFDENDDGILHGAAPQTPASALSLQPGGLVTESSDDYYHGVDATKPASTASPAGGGEDAPPDLFGLHADVSMDVAPLEGGGEFRTDNAAGGGGGGGAAAEGMQDGEGSSTDDLCCCCSSGNAQRSLSKTMRAFRETVNSFCARVRALTLRQIIAIVVLVLLVMVGNAMQILMLNFWLVSFPADGAPGNYTAFAVPGILYSGFFLILLIVYMIVKRPNMNFAKHWYGWGLLVGIGFCDTFNSWLATYAASHTSEVLQALFTNLCPLYAVFMSKWILQDPRRYLNWWIVAVFVLTILGILVASLYNLITKGNSPKGSEQWWILIFFFSIPFRVLMNVWQSLYMIVYTKDSAFVGWFRQYSARVAGMGGGELLLDVHMDASVAAFVIEDEALYEVIEPGADSEQHDNGNIGEWGAEKTRERSKDGGSVRDRVEKACDGNDKNNGRSREEDDSLDHCLPASVDMPGPRESTVLFSAEEEVIGIAGSNSCGNKKKTKEQTIQSAAEAELSSARYHQGEDTIVKVLMLAAETTFQLMFTLALLPADALPWWGNSDTVSATWHNFVAGVTCVFTIPNNFAFGFLYTLGFVFTYIGCAYLNHYSVALCSIVSQLSSPLTALLLVIVPKWNVMGEDEGKWYFNVIAIILLSVAALVYVMWEEMTDAEKVEGERVLKMRKLHLHLTLPSNPDANEGELELAAEATNTYTAEGTK